MEHPMADADPESTSVDQETLVADIDRTRAELARTIDAISDRVSPKNNARRAMEQLRQRASQLEEQLRQRASQLEEQLRQRASQLDPIMAGGAAAAVALGVTLLIMWRRYKR
jgi:CHASE3 domain sensor protein